MAPSIAHSPFDRLRANGMSYDAMKTAMTAAYAVEIVQFLSDNGISVQVDGGWGVDALLGEQTRSHVDLDIGMQHKDVPRLRELLESTGYKEIARDDSWECNFVLADEFGHEIDVHSCTFDADGNNVFGVAYPAESLTGTGTIEGYQVDCVPPEWMVKFHSGYELKMSDYCDVSALCERFGIELPSEYDKFREDLSGSAI
jgi:lincosamide nucleotidyltransferase A/C/D/E